MSIYANITNRKPIYRGIYWGIYGQDSDPLVFHALTHAGASGGVDAAGNTLLPYEGTDTLVATVAGLTEARTSTNYSPDHEGIWRSWGSGEAVREGFRQVENLFPYSEATTGWLQTGVTATGGQSDPFGGSGAVSLSCSGSWAYYRNISEGSSADVPRVFSVWVKRNTSSDQTFRLQVKGGALSGDLTATNTWQRFSASASASGQACGIFTDSSNNAAELLVYGFQCENATGRSNTTNPSEYVPTTSAAAKKYFASTNPWEVTSKVATPTATVTELTDIWTVGSPAHTNSLPYSLPSVDQWSLTEGSAGDLVTNGDFQTGDGTGWSLGTGSSVVDSGGGAYVLRYAGTESTVSTSQNMGAISGKIYKVTFTVSNYSAGTVRPRFGASGAGAAVNSNGAYTQYITAASSSLDFQGQSYFTGDIDNVIVQEAVISSYTTGLDGAADSAVVLTDDDGAVFERVTETITIPNDSNVNVARFWVKKDTDETRFPEFSFDLNGGTQQREFVMLNTSTGATSTRLTVGTTDHEVRDTGHGWWEILISIANNSTGNTNGTISVGPAYATTLGSPSSAATGSITVANCELHLNTTIAAVRGSSPIMTDGSAASTVASAMSFSDQNHSDDQGLWSCEFKNVGLNATNTGGLITLGSTGIPIYTNSAVRFQTYDGTNVVNGSAVTLAADDTEYKVAVSYGGSSLSVTTDAVTGAVGSYAGSFGNTLSKISVAASSVGAAPKATMLIRDIRRYNLPYASAVTKAEEVTS